MPHTHLDSDEDKQQVIAVFQPLLSNSFGGDKYLKFYLQDAKQLINSHLDIELKKRELSHKARMKCHETRVAINKAKSMDKVLTTLADVCLLDEELEEEL